MTVRVVSEKPVKFQRVTCSKCGYELEYTGEDIITSSDSEGYPKQMIACPRGTCRHYMRVKWYQ